MNNMHPPHDGDSGDWPTEQMDAMTGEQGRPEPGGPARSYDPAGAPGMGASARGMGRRLRLGIAVAAAAVLLCGGAAAGVALAGGTSLASSGPAGQAAQLSTMLSSASSSASSATALAGIAPAATPAAARCRTTARHLRAAGRPRAARAVLRACRRHLLRLRVLAGIHGQFTFETKKGPRTLAFERGVVESVSPSSVVVRAQDGTTWTWDLVSNTVIRQNARRAATSALSAGQHVFVGGPVTSGAKDARLIVIRAGGGTSTSS
jgi:hypothetical protein